MSKQLRVILMFLTIFLFGHSAHGQAIDTLGYTNADYQRQISMAKTDSAKAYWQNLLARVLSAQGSKDEAIDLFTQTLVYQNRVKNQLAIAKATGNIGLNYLAKKEPQKALVFLENALVAARKSKDKNTQFSLYNSLISTHNTLGNTAKAFEITQQLLKFGELEKDENILGLGYYYAGYFFHLNNNLEKAADNYRIALGHYSKTNDADMIAKLQINMGEYFINQNQLDSAKVYLTNSLAVLIKTGDKESIARVYERIANLYATEGDFTNANKQLEMALKLAHELKDKSLEALFGFGIERNNFQKLTSELVFNNRKATLNANQRKELEGIIERTESHIDNFRNETTNFVALSGMEELLSGEKEVFGDYEGAFKSYIKHVNYRDSFSSQSKLNEFATVEAKFLLEKAQNSIKLVEEQKRLELQKEMALNKLKFEFEKKRALAKTDAERELLLVEESAKRAQIEAEFNQKREAASLKYVQEKALAKANEEKNKATSLAELRQSNNIRNMSLLGAGVLLLSAGFFGYAYSQKRKDNKAIAFEKKRSDDLLLNILPAEIAEELKQDGSSAAQKHEEVSVLFTDFVNFTQTSEKIGVEDLLNELNINFTAFDNIMEKHGMEKIKTIGDAYLAVSGLPKWNEQHAQNAVLAALDILKFVENRKKETPYGLDIRIGINSGPLIAGIIGVKKFAYDIWGDTVNIAARMEQSGAPGKVNISENTYTLVKQDFSFEHRGKIEAKNKGEMDMYFVTSKSRNHGV